MSFVFNPIKNDQTTLFSSGGSSSAVTLNNTYPPPNDQSGVSDTTAPTTSVARSIFVLASNTSNVASTALQTSTTNFATSATTVVQLANATAGLRLGTVATPSGASGGYTTISEAGKDVFIQGVMNPLTIGGALGAEATNLAANANNSAFEMTTRVLSAFTISLRNMPVFIFNTIGATGFVGFDVLVNNVSIYQASGAYAWVATQTVAASLTPSTTSAAGTYTTPWIRAVNNATQTSLLAANRTTDGNDSGAASADLGFTSRGFLRSANITVSKYDLITFRVIGSPNSPILATGWRGLKAFIYIA